MLQFTSWDHAMHCGCTGDYSSLIACHWEEAVCGDHQSWIVFKKHWESLSLPFRFADTAVSCFRIADTACAFLCCSNFLTTASLHSQCNLKRRPEPDSNACQPDWRHLLALISSFEFAAKTLRRKWWFNFESDHRRIAFEDDVTVSLDRVTRNLTPNKWYMSIFQSGLHCPCEGCWLILNSESEKRSLKVR
jgi:hypothetical protein